MSDSMISIKGIADGVFISVEGNDYNKIKQALELKINENIDFFKGSKLINIVGDELTLDIKTEIMLLLKYKYDFILKDEEIPSSKEIESQEKSQASTTTNIVEEGMTKFVHGTLRSGQEVSYNGNIVIIGDVNPGAVLRAKGNIIVLGLLRGVAHAGIGGNKNAVVAAYSLLPTQLRIDDIIVRPPEGDSYYKYPEIARIIEDKVIIEPYLPNK
ncbi:septum site-determining protein MinC [Soehngenia saccharolytica]|nr:septum site-determining protein MinC [Soehngenia saccharolytica]